MEELVKNELLFYSKLAKPLILNLPKSRDRVLSAAWLKKFADENSGDEKQRTTYLKLLLFCLQRRSLSGIFADDPSNYEVLEELPQDIDLNEFARNLLEQERVERRELILAEVMGDMPVFPAFTTDCSPDLTEYVAAQDIPNFGVHAYYAISKQPINKWQRSELAIFPKGTKSAIDTTQTTTPPTAAPPTPKVTSSAPEVEQPAAEDEDSPPKPPSPERKKRRPKKLGASPPTHPLGEVRKPSEERPTPTWGTNLVEVRERTDVGHIEEPTEAEKDLEKEVARMLQEQSDDDEEEASARPSEDTVASAANEMSYVLDEFQRSKMDKPKKKPPSRLAKLGDRSGLKAPKSTKAPKIEVKGMKKKAKGGIGPRPDNFPEEFADWTEKDLQEAGLTWQDLMPIDDNIDEELQRIEDEEMKDLSGGEIYDESLHLEDITTDYDALLREAEAELAQFQEVYGAGVEEDEPVVELFQDEIEEMENRLNISHEVENVRTASPAITKGIPVTTPQRSASPKRVKSPEKVYAEDDDFLLKHRRSPLQPPKPQKREIPKRQLPKPKPPSDKDPNVSMVFEKAQKVIPSAEERAGKRVSPGRCPPSPQASEATKRTAGRGSPSPMTEDEEFEMYERMFKQESPEGGRHVTVQEQPPAGPSAVEERARQQEMMLRSGSPQAKEIIQEVEQSFRGPPSPSPDPIYPFGPSPREKRKRPPPRPRPTPPPSPPYIFPQYSSPHTPIPQRPIRRPKGYVSPPDSPMYGPEERPQDYASPPQPEEAQKRSQFMTSPPRMISGVQYDTGIDEELTPEFPMSPPPFPESPEDLIRREARKLFSGKQPCNVCVTEPAPPPPCGPCDSEEKTPKRSRSRRKGKWPVSRSPSPVGLDEFEEMERLAQMDESPAPCAGPPMPQFHESPGEAQRIRQRALAQYHLLGQEPLVTPEGAPGPSRRRTGHTPPQDDYNSDFDATPEKPPTPVQRFPKAKRRVFKKTPPPQPQQQMMDDLDIPPGYGSPLAEETPPLDFASPLPNLLQPDQMYFPGECMPCGSPEQFPSRAELREHRFVPDRTHARISQRTPFGRGPGRVQHRESTSAFQQMPQISEGEQGHRMDYTPKRPRHDAMPPREFRSPRIKPQLSPPTESQLFGEAFKYNLDLPAERHRTPKVCPSARKRIEPRSQLGDTMQRHRQLVGAAQEGGLTEFEEDQQFKDLADQADLAFDYEGCLLDVSPPQDFEAGQNYYPEIAAATDKLLQSLEDYETHNLTGYYDTKFAAPKQIADLYDSPEYLPKTRPPPARSPVRAESPCPRSTREAPVVTCPGAATAEATKKKPAGKKALKETRSSQLRKEKIAKQQQAEKEAQMKKERAAAAKKEKAQAKRRAAQAQRSTQRAAAQQAAMEESLLPGPEFMDELQQHEVKFPGFQRSLMVGQKMKKLSRVSRRQFAGFEEHPREEEEPEDEGYLEDYAYAPDFVDEQPPEDFDFTPPRTPNYEEMLFTQQFEDTPPMDDFLDPSFLERDDEALLMTPPRRPPSPEHIAASPMRQPPPPCVPCSPPLDEFERTEREMEEMQRHEERFLPEEFLTQMEQQRQETIGAMGMAAGGRMAPPSADRHMERLDRHIAREERRAKKKRSRQNFDEIQRRVAEQEAAIEAERVQAEYDRPPSPLMAYSPTTPPRPDGGECVPCYPVEDGYFFETMQTPHPGLFEGNEDMQAEIAGYQSPEPLSPYRIPEEFGPEIFDYQRQQQEEMNRQLREDMQFHMDYSDVDVLDEEQFDGYYSPPPLSPECVPCTPPNRQQLEAAERQRAMTESYFQQEKQELRQMFGPSCSPISPGPDESFRTAVASHQVPERFKRGGRPKFRVRDQVGSRDFTMVLPRKYPPTGMETIQEPEPRRPQQSRLARPAGIPTMIGRPGPTTAPASCGSGGPCGGSQAPRALRPPTSYGAVGQGQRSLRPPMQRQQGQRLVESRSSQMQRQARGGTCPGPSSSRSRLQGSSSQSRIGSQDSSRTSSQTQASRANAAPEHDPRRLVRKTSSYKKIVYRRN